MKWSKILLPTFAFTRLLNKLCENEVTLREKSLPLTCCKHFEHLTHFEIIFTSFNAGNMGSVGQRDAKLPSFKLLE